MLSRWARCGRGLPLFPPDGEDTAQPGQPAALGAGPVSCLTCAVNALAVPCERVLIPRLLLLSVRSATLLRLLEHVTRMIR